MAKANWRGVISMLLSILCDCRFLIILDNDSNQQIKVIEKIQNAKKSNFDMLEY